MYALDVSTVREPHCQYNSTNSPPGVAAVSRIGDVAALVTKHSKAAIAVMLVLTLVVSAGAPMVDQSSSLDQFQTESDASQKLDYIEANFTSSDENTTTVQIVVRDDNVLTKDALVGALEYERALYDNETVNETLAGEDAVTGIANVVATASPRQEEGRELQTTVQEFEQLNQTVQSERAAVEQRSTELNATAESLRAELTYLRENPDASVGAAFDRVRANSSVELTDSHYQPFEQAASDLRSASSQSEVEAAYRLGTRGVLEAEYTALEERSTELEAQAERLQELGAELETQRAEYENASDASLDEQLAELRSLNDSEVESLVTTVLGGGQNGGNGQSVFGLMPTAYEPGSTTAEATMLVATQETESEVPAGGQTTSDAIIDAQLAMQDLGEDRSQDYLVFGGGIISHEINTSMTDSLLIVGPLAILFVLVALAVAETAPDGSEVALSGRVLAGGDEHDVGGDDGAAVVADIFERVFAQAEVTDSDLAEASAAFEDGKLSADQYDRVVREWARERPEEK